MAEVSVQVGTAWFMYVFFAIPSGWNIHLHPVGTLLCLEHLRPATT